VRKRQLKILQKAQVALLESSVSGIGGGHTHTFASVL